MHGCPPFFLSLGPTQQDTAHFDYWISNLVAWYKSWSHNDKKGSSWALIGQVDWKRLKKKSFNSKLNLYELGPDHTWLWILNFNWSIFSPI